MNNQEMSHWWEGYVVVRVHGRRLERLINRMMNQRFSAWNLSRADEETAHFSITIHDFKRLRALLKETGCKVSIEKKIGLPFLMRKMKRRMGLTIGAISFCCLLYLLSMMIWTVEIEGLKYPEDELQVRQELAQIGIKPGGFKNKVMDNSEVQRYIVEVFPSITWAGFDFKGTTAHLKVVEKTIPEINTQSAPRHLIATKKAIIHDIYVEEGKPMVKPNQYVQPGDLLVSGIIGREDEPTFVRAEGKILGEVWYEGEVGIPLTQIQHILTGENKKRYYLQFGSYSLKIWGFGKIKYEEYQLSEEQYAWERLSKLLPLAWKKEVVSATDQIVREISEEDAYQIGIKQGRNKLYQRLDNSAEIKEENVLKKRVENGKVYMKIHYTVIEEIGKEQLIH